MRRRVAPELPSGKRRLAALKLQLPWGVFSKGTHPLPTQPSGPACQFTEAWTPAPLLERVWVDAEVVVLTFGLPDPSAPLGCGDAYITCVLARGGRDPATGAAFVRPYTPMATTGVGSFRLNVRVYESGKLSRHLAEMPVGDFLEFRHVPPGHYAQRFLAAADDVAFVCAGTAITTAFQAAERVLRRGRATRVRLVYGSRTTASILNKGDLDALAAAHGDKLVVTHVLSREPADSGWRGERGRVDRGVLKRHLPPPRGSVIVYVCGPAGLCDALCGGGGDGPPPPRCFPSGRRKARGLLGDLGYDRRAVCRL